MTQVDINSRLPYSVGFQNEFLKVFDKNTNILKYWSIKDEAFLLLEAYPLPSKWQDIPSVYLPFRFMNYNLTYRHEGNEK